MITMTMRRLPPRLSFPPAQPRSMAANQVLQTQACDVASHGQLFAYLGGAVVYPFLFLPEAL